MNDNDLEGQLRAQAGPREEGYVPVRLPASLDEAPSHHPSPVLRAAVLVPAVAAGVVVVAVAAAAIRGFGPGGSTLGSGGSSQASATAVPTAQPTSPAIASCRSEDFAWSTDPWTGAAGSRGTNALMRGVSSLDGCTVEGAITVEIRDASGHVLVSNTSENHQRVAAGDVFEVGIAWSNWCNSDPAQPGSADLRLPGDEADVPLISSGGQDIPIPPCNGPGQPTNLSVTELQRSNRPFPEG
ncbi:MAG TPA: hypothetical protein VF153_09330 [Candidatus Limnocylindria bacterium]